jgi:predicted O-methyltransferase YrrM
VGKIQGVTVGKQFANTPEGAKIEQIFQDSTTFRLEALRGQVDFCFIDGGHMYETVSRDTENALALVKPGGIIMWHDYSRWWPGVQRCLDELVRHLPVFRLADTGLAAVQLPHS